MKPRILVTGGDGMVGQYFADHADCLRLSRTAFNVTNPEQTQAVLEELLPEAIIHLAAATNVDACQADPPTAYDVNTVATYRLAQLARRLNIHLVYVSTGGVFPGTKRRPFTPDDKPDPLSIYTRSKLLGELMVRDTLPSALIARTGWLFGGGPVDKKFVAHIVRQVREGSSEIRAVDDIYGNPTYARDLANFLREAALRKEGGLHHVVNRGRASRYEMAVYIAQLLNKEGSPPVQVLPAKSADFPNFSAPRPAFEVIRPTVRLRHWKPALKEYITSWFATH